ncbi:MAG: ArgP/LysG family DNA-binding transcriptional regulator, partial [Microbacteriaceae bacterium]|nr:ArgP/LysG family DNA-binding transcriptional regulator [Burkholderiaceae bacterium]
FGLKRVMLNQLFVPSSEGQVRAVLAGWGASVLPIQLYWHCWNLVTEVLDALSCALTRASDRALAS